MVCLSEERKYVGYIKTKDSTLDEVSKQRRKGEEGWWGAEQKASDFAESQSLIL